MFAEPSLNDAIATLAVPSYAAEQGLRTFADIAKFKEQLGGKIYGIEPGTGANSTIQKMIDSNQFGLGDFKMIESSEAAMLAAVGRANARKEPIVFVGWKPHPMNIQLQMTYLTGSEDVFGANEGAASVSTVTAPNYAERCPNVNRLLKMHRQMADTMKKIGKMGKGGMLKQAMAAMQGKGGGLPAAGEMDPAQMEAAAKQLGQMPGMGKLPGLGGMGGLSGLGGLGGLGGFGKKK